MPRRVGVEERGRTTMAGTMGCSGDFNGSGSGTRVDLPCSHDEAELRTAAAALGAANEELDGARDAVSRADAAEWSGPAATAFRGTTAALAAQLSAIAAGLAGLAPIVAALRSEAAACPGALCGLPPGPLGLALGVPALPAVPLPSRTPALQLPASGGPVYARGLAGWGPSMPFASGEGQ